MQTKQEDTAHNAGEINHLNWPRIDPERGLRDKGTDRAL